MHLGVSVLVVDSYDSFTYNLVHCLEGLGASCTVFKNDKLSVEDVNSYDKIILSPGPGLPEEAGLLIPIIKKYAAIKPIMGICLGCQAIGQVFGSELYNMGNVVHGKMKNTTIIAEDVIFRGLNSEFQSGRYHSWALRNVTDPLLVTAVDDNGVVMAIKHLKYNIRGIQFHPESIMTPEGSKMLKNWLEYC